MISYKPIHGVLLLHLLVGTLFGGVHQEAYAQNAQAASISVNATGGRPIPQEFFGIFFEEINHAGAGGLWSELVSNRGFERGGKHSPSMITPWGRVGDEISISINTELVSCFKSNPVALRMDVLCDGNCPLGGVGVFNPGYWGMNIEQGKSYKLVFYTKATGPLELTASFNSPDGSQVLASGNIVADAAKVKDWSKMELTLEAKGSDPKARLQLTTNKKGTIWLDQVSAMPTDTFKGHGFRKDMAQMLVDLKPRFLRFPGGCFVEGEWLRHAFRWKETIGPWEERPGHMGDVWKYWSDDGLGYLEYLQLAEDLGAEPVWVINNGISHREEVDTTLIAPFVQEMLDSIEFAIGSPNSTWGSLRAKYGHPQPFSLKYVAIGNEDCGKKNYKGNYMKFYEALKRAYPDIKSISNCDGSSNQPLDHPTDLYDYHNYTTAEGMLDIHNILEKKPRDGPKAFVSEYAVTEPHDKIGNGTFKGALGEAAFLISLEKISDIVSMVSYAPLFAHENDIYWSPDAVFFNSNQLYAIGSYWVQTFFSDSSGATLLDATMQLDSNLPIYYSAISFKDPLDQKNYIRIKVVNFQDKGASLKISLNGVDAGAVQGARKTVFASTDLWGDNSFANPKKMAPQTSPFQASGKDLDVQVDPYSLTSFDLLSSGGGDGSTTTTGTAQPKISQPNAANSAPQPTLTKV